MMHAYQGIWPKLHETVFLADGCQIIGEVEVGAHSSIWFNSVLRGDMAPIFIGGRVNIQDGCIGHVNTGQPLVVHDEVSVGHGAIIHGCTVGAGSLIGMGAIILNGAEIGEFSLVAAGSLVAENKKIPAYTLCMGTPAKVVRELTEEDLARLKRTTENYVHKARVFREEGARNEI